MSEAHFLRRQLIVVGFLFPAGYVLLSFPSALMADLSFLVRPFYGVAFLAAFAGYCTLGIVAGRRERAVWTALFLLVSSTPLFGQFVILPEMQERHFREFKHIPDDARILYYRETERPDITRFCIVQHPTNIPPRSNVTHYRPFLPGALSIMSAVQRDLGIPDSKMPDPSKRSIFYSAGSNETAPGMWMYMDVNDSATSQEWLFEYGY